MNTLVTKIIPIRTVKFNRIQCRYCKEIIESIHRYHYLSCKCGTCANYGGKCFPKRLGYPFIELTEYHTIL